MKPLGTLLIENSYPQHQQLLSELVPRVIPIQIGIFIQLTHELDVISSWFAIRGFGDLGRIYRIYFVAIVSNRILDEIYSFFSPSSLIVGPLCYFSKQSTSALLVKLERCSGCAALPGVPGFLSLTALIVTHSLMLS